MPAKERLSLAEIAVDDLIASSHVHRYELAASLVAGQSVLDLCCGTGYGSRLLAQAAERVVGVDVDAAAIAEAEAAGMGETVSFVVDDAQHHVERLPPGSVGAVICFEGIEHVPDPEALAAALARLADDGTRIALSFPNSRAFGEENEFHVTDFGYDSMLELLDVFPEAIVLRQYLAEGSLIVGPGAGPSEDGLAGRLSNPERAEPEWANHYIALIGFDPAAVGAAVERLSIASNPNYNSYVRSLERSNRSLWRTNVTLGRNALGTWDAAAASVLAKDRARIHELEKELEVANTLRERAEVSAWQNDQWLQQERLHNQKLRFVISGLRRLADLAPGRSGR